MTPDTVETLPSAVVVAAAPTGAYKSRLDYPSLPVEADQIAEEAHACLEAGASMLHLHVRDAAGRHSLDAALYRRAIDVVRRRCGNALLIQVTSEQAGTYDAEAQARAVGKIEADFISIALSEVIGGRSDAELERAARLFEELERRGTRVQVILYEPAHLPVLRQLQGEGVVPARPTPLLFVLGRYLRDRNSAPEDLDPFLAEDVGDDPWMICAFGAHEIECMRYAAARGGHVRVGFENNTVRPDGRPLGSTAESVALVREALTADGLAVAGNARTVLLG